MEPKKNVCEKNGTLVLTLKNDM